MRTLLVPVFFVLATSAVHAQQPPREVRDGIAITEYERDRRGFLMRSDQDQDGKLDPVELKDGFARAMEEEREAGLAGWAAAGDAGMFAALDTNKDGYIQPEEINSDTIQRQSRYGLQRRREANRKAAAKPVPPAPAQKR